MKVAVPVFGTRVSPRFDCATAFLVADVADGAVGEARHVAGAGPNPLQCTAQLRELGVDAVVCGAITGFLLRHLIANGIRVFPWVSCEAAEALATLARGELPPSTTLRRGGPGRCGRGRARGRGRGGPQWPR